MVIENRELDGEKIGHDTKIFRSKKGNVGVVHAMARMTIGQLNCDFAELIALNAVSPP